jgi:glycerate 2-kinase
MHMMRPQIINDLTQEALKLLDPYQSIQSQLELCDGEIRAKDFTLKVEKRLHLFSVGKVASYQLEAFLRFLEGHPLAQSIGQCVSYTKKGQATGSPLFIELEGDHPLLNAHNIQQSYRFLSYLDQVNPDDSVIFMISGGTSALLEIPKDDLSFKEIEKCHEELLRSGLGINEVNERRRELSTIKGGGLKEILEKRIDAKNVLQLITCDIPNGNLADVGSGPLFDGTGAGIYAVCLQSADSLLSELLLRFPYMEMGKIYDCKLSEMEEDLLGLLIKKGSGPLFHLSGGEATIVVPTHAMVGGRNTHFVLSMAQKIYASKEYEKLWDLQIMSFGTDGSDGNCPCAGAYINYDLWSKNEAQSYLESYNSYGYFSELGTLIETGPTKTNVMDLRLIWRE